MVGSGTHGPAGQRAQPPSPGFANPVRGHVLVVEEGGVVGGVVLSLEP